MISTTKRGSIVLLILVILVAVVLTSALVLFLMKSGPTESSASPLAVEFIPERPTTLTINQFEFCSDVNSRFVCTEKRTSFRLGEEVHFRLVVESSVKDQVVSLVENYQLTDPPGTVLLPLDEKNDFHLNLNSQREKEQVAFRDYFIVSPESIPGNYTLTLFIENPVLNKKVTLTKTITIQEDVIS
ncbi:TPA: hypothetical protein HA241_06250 [Candidatus Woesearchaeota archaeon]|nr:hypothetical protein [Candidatus Woesearchaeota archaeon]